MRMKTVSMKKIPRDRATVLNRFLFITILVLPYWGERSSEVTRRIIAVTAVQRLRSEKDRGEFIFSNLDYSVSRSNPRAIDLRHINQRSFLSQRSFRVVEKPPPLERRCLVIYSQKSN